MKATVVLLLYAAGCLMAQNAAQFRLEAVNFEGSRYPSQGLLKLSGLVIGAPVNESDFAAAAARLGESGFVQSAQFAFKSGSANGYLLTLRVSDAPAEKDVVIDIPGLGESDAWAALEGVHPILIKRVPANDRAQALYVRSLEQYLAGKGITTPLTVAVDGGVLGSGNTTIVIEPKAPPVITAVSFPGARTVPGEELRRAIEGVALQQGFTERRLRKLLELNVRPLLEEYGLLQAKFTSVTASDPRAAGTAVTVAVDEGRIWNLGAVQIEGDVPAGIKGVFDAGKPIKWSSVVAGIEGIKTPLRRDGYITVRSSVTRKFRDVEGAVDLGVNVQRGPQYQFGSVAINGLSPAALKTATKIWKLKPGDPMDGLYTDEFLKAVFRELSGAPIKSVAKELKPRGQIVDVIINFQ